MNSGHHDRVLGMGRRMVADEQQGHSKAPYGEQFIGQLAIELTARFVLGFSCTNVFQIADALIMWS